MTSSMTPTVRNLLPSIPLHFPDYNFAAIPVRIRATGQEGTCFHAMNNGDGRSVIKVVVSGGEIVDLMSDDVQVNLARPQGYAFAMNYAALHATTPAEFKVVEGMAADWVGWIGVRPFEHQRALAKMVKVIVERRAGQ